MSGARRKAEQSRKPAPIVTDKPSPELNGEQPDPGPQSPLTDGQMVSVLAAQLNRARLCHYEILQRFGAKKVEHGELSWEQATQFINGLGAAFEQAIEATGRQLSTDLIAKGQQEGHS